MMETEKDVVSGEKGLDFSVGLDLIKRKLGFELHDQRVLRSAGSVSGPGKNIEHFLVISKTTDAEDHLAGNDLVGFIVKGNGSRECRLEEL